MVRPGGGRVPSRTAPASRSAARPPLATRGKDRLEIAASTMIASQVGTSSAASRWVVVSQQFNIPHLGADDIPLSAFEPGKWAKLLPPGGFWKRPSPDGASLRKPV